MSLQKSWRYWSLLTAVFTLGIIAGRQFLAVQTQPTDQGTIVETHVASSTPTQDKLADQEFHSDSQARNASDVADEVDTGEVLAIVKRERVVALDVVSVQDAVLHIEQLTEQELYRSSTYARFNATFLANPDIATGLLELLLDMGDPALQFKTSRLLQHYIAKNPDSRLNKYIAEDWVMQQIRDQNRSDEWLHVIKNWGVKSKDNALFLSEQIAKSFNDEQAAAQIWALSRSYLPEHPGAFNYKRDEITSISDKIAPFLTNDNEYLRSAAVRSLRAFRGDNFNHSLVTAIEDQSQLVRMTGWVVASESGTSNMELLPRALSAMENEGLSVLERGTAYRLIQNFNLDSAAYDRVQRFRNQQNEAAFDQEYRQQLSQRLEQLGVDTRYFYEF